MAGMNGGSRIIDLRTGTAPAVDDDLLISEEMEAPPPIPIAPPAEEEYVTEEEVTPDSRRLFAACSRCVGFARLDRRNAVVGA